MHDEAQLQATIEFRKAIDALREAGGSLDLNAFAARVYQQPQFCGEMWERWKALRDALAPFDSGTLAKIAGVQPVAK